MLVLSYVPGGEAEGLGGARFDNEGGGRSEGVEMVLVHFEDGLRCFEEGDLCLVEEDLDLEEGLDLEGRADLYLVEGLRFFWEGLVFCEAVCLSGLFFGLAGFLTVPPTPSPTSKVARSSASWVALSLVAVSDGVERRTKPEALSRSSRMSAASSQHVASGIGFPIR